MTMTSLSKTTLCILLCLVFASGARDLRAAPVQEIPWGLSLAEFTGNLTGGNHREFKPSDMPDYKNKIMTYITAIDEKFKDEIVIVRLKGSPLCDYLFVRGKLCTKLDDWDVITEETQNRIMADLKGHYGEPSLQREENFFIYSFKSKTTNVMFYMLKGPDGRAKCKVYYYTSKLFKMLIMDN